MEHFKSKDLGLRVQKKILSRMATKNVVKVFIDDNSAKLLDNLYKLVKLYTGNKKEAEKLVKNIIKIVVKLAIIHRNSQLTQEDYILAKKVEQKFTSCLMAIISFYEVEFSYDRGFIIKHLTDCESALSSIVKRHLTDKSLARVEHIFNFFKNPQFLDSVFKGNSEFHELVGRMVGDMNKALDNGEL